MSYFLARQVDSREGYPAQRAADHPALPAAQLAAGGGAGAELQAARERYVHAAAADEH